MRKKRLIRELLRRVGNLEAAKQELGSLVDSAKGRLDTIDRLNVQFQKQICELVPACTCEHLRNKGFTGPHQTWCPVLHRQFLLQARELYTNLAARLEMIEKERVLDVKVGSSNERAAIVAYLRVEKERLERLAVEPGGSGLYEDAKLVQIAIDDIENGNHLK